MSTADDVRRSQWQAYWRMREYQQSIQESFTIPLAKMLMEKMLEKYPPPHEQDETDGL